MIDYSLRSLHAGIKIILFMIYCIMDLRSIRAEELVGPSLFFIECETGSMNRYTWNQATDSGSVYVCLFIRPLIEHNILDTTNQILIDGRKWVS